MFPFDLRGGCALCVRFSRGFCLTEVGMEDIMGFVIHKRFLWFLFCNQIEITILIIIVNVLF